MTNERGGCFSADAARSADDEGQSVGRLGHRVLLGFRSRTKTHYA
jgi:hypothetical protein